MAKENSWGMHAETFPQHELRHLPTFVKELLAGGVAGGISKTCVAPLERVKILFQTSRMTNNSISQTLQRLLQEEGFAGWFRGNGASVLRIVPYAGFNFGAYEQYRLFLARYVYGAEAEHHHIPPVMDLLAGSAAGGTAVLMTYPLDLVRTRLAYGSERARPTEQSAAGGSKQAHDRRQHRTVSCQSLQSLPSSVSAAGLVMARSESGRLAEPSGQPVQSSRAPSGEPPGAAHTSSGKPTIRAVLIDTAKREGAVGLYRGIGPTLLGIVPYAGMKFYIYQSLKQYYWQLQQDPGAHSDGAPKRSLNRRLPVWLMLSFGAFSGVVAQTITYPLDVVRRHMQVQSLRGDAFSQQKFSSTWGGLSAITRQKGFWALFAGLSINYLKVIPSTAIGFTIYDAAKQYLDLPQNL